jgi:hypothetical protein
VLVGEAGVRLTLKMQQLTWLVKQLSEETINQLSRFEQAIRALRLRTGD